MVNSNESTDLQGNRGDNDDAVLPSTVSPAIPGEGQRLGSSASAAIFVDDYPTNDIDYGCVWDGDNYSCAYDSAFMAIFSTYRHTDSSWRQR